MHFQSNADDAGQCPCLIVYNLRRCYCPFLILWFLVMLEFLALLVRSDQWFCACFGIFLLKQCIAYAIMVMVIHDTTSPDVVFLSG